MTQPITRNYLEAPFQTLAHYDVGLVRRILLDMEQGLFRDAAIMVDAMTRDDRIGAVLTNRVQHIFGLPFEWTQTDAFGARRLKELEAMWPDMWPEGSKEELLKWKTMMGVGLAELQWDISGPVWKPVVKVWHPQWLRYDQTLREWRLQTQDAGEITIQPGDGKWVLLGSEKSWMQGAVRMLSIIWLIRGYAFRDWARSSEVHGMPIIVGETPSNADKDDKKRFIRDLRQLGAETKILAPQGANKGDPGFAVKLIEAMANNHMGFKDLISETNSCIAIVLLGQNLSTEVKGGSFAAANTHERVRQDVAAADAKLFGSAVQKQILTHWARINFGQGTTPFPCWKADPPEDAKAEAQTLNTFADAATKLDKLGVDIDPLLEKKGLKRTKPAVADPAQPPQPAAAGVGLKLIDNVLRLASGASPEQNSGFLDGQLYADALVDQGLRASKDSVTAVRTAILQAVDAATGYEDLKLRLQACFRDLDPDLFRPLMERALILGQLAGRTSVQEDL